MPQDTNTKRDVLIVTGSSGLIGGPTVRHFAGRLQVVGFDRDGNARPPKEAECVCADVTSDESVQAGMARVSALRFINVLFGAWIIAAPWVLSGATTGATWNDVVAGALLIVLSLRRGEARERYGSWDRFIV